MADRKISDLTALTAPAAGDYLPIVDISEASAANKNKRITIEELLRGAPDGTAAAPSIGFESDPNTGIYSPGADQLAISTGGSGRLFVDSSGRVGIGNSSPQSAVDVLSGVRGVPETSGSTTSVTTLRLRGASNGVLDIGELSSATAGSYWLQVRDRTDLGTEYNLALQPNGGNVGIGTTSPNELLEVAGNIHLSGADRSIFNRSNNALTFGTNNAERARIDSSGRLLVGTSSARNVFDNSYAPRLQVEGTDATHTLSVVVNAGSTDGSYLFLAKSRGGSAGSNVVVQSGDRLGAIVYQGADGAKLVRAAQIEAFVDGTPGANDMPGRLVFSTTADGASSPTERMRITSVGEVCIGTTSAHVANRSALENATTGQLTFRHSSTTAGHFNIVGMNSGSAFVVSDSSGATGVQLAYSGTSWSTLSDERQKTDLTPIDDGLTKVGTLRAVTGRLVTDPETKSRSFLIAQDVQAVLPQAVDTTDPDALALSYTEVIPLLVAALKESKERIETLEAKVAALEAA